MRISVLGLGKMGAPMARNLVEVGHEVTLYSRNQERAIDLAIKGALVALTVEDAVSEAQVALTMLSDDEAERALTFEEGGLLAHLPSGAIHLCMSTIGVETSRELASAHAKAGQGYVAAPVFGRPGTAASRNLWIMVGGPDIQVNRCLTIFDALGRGLTRVGPQAELAHALKLGGDMLTVAMVEGLSEVLVYGEKAGMAPVEYLRLLNSAIFKSPAMDAFGGLVVRRLHDPADLTLEAALKDMQMTLRASEELDAVMPMAELLHQRLEAAAVAGWGAQDLTVLSRACRLAAGLEERALEVVSGVHKKKARVSHFTATAPEGDLDLDLQQVTHFELIQDTVWAWTQGQSYRTAWKHLAEVERTFEHVPFLRLHRHILLPPEAPPAHHSLPGAVRKKAVEEKIYSPPASLEATRTIVPPKAVENQVVPEMVRAPRFEVANRAVRDQGPGKGYLAYFRDLIGRTFERIPALRSQLQILIKPSQEIADQPLALPQTSKGDKLESEVPSVDKHPAASPTQAIEEQGMLELGEITHFEVEHGVVWAWVEGKRRRTRWRSLPEIEAAFSHVYLLKIQRNILLHPEMVLSIQPAFGGTAKVTVAGGMELDVNKAAAKRLKELLGI